MPVQSLIVKMNYVNFAYFNEPLPIISVSFSIQEGLSKLQHESQHFEIYIKCIYKSLTLLYACTRFSDSLTVYCACLLRLYTKCAQFIIQFCFTLLRAKYRHSQNHG